MFTVEQITAMFTSAIGLVDKNDKRITVLEDQITIMLMNQRAAAPANDNRNERVTEALRNYMNETNPAQKALMREIWHVAIIEVYDDTYKASMHNNAAQKRFLGEVV